MGHKHLVLMTFLPVLVVLSGCAPAPDEPLRTANDGSVGTPTSVHPSPYPLSLSACRALDASVDNVIVNGGFEGGEFGWRIHSSGTGSTWREHPLIGSGGSFQAHSGTASVRLGGYEGSSDRLQQAVIIPPEGLLTYWWQINYPRAMSRLSVLLVEPDGSDEIVLTMHTHEDSMQGWQIDCIDLRSFSGEEYLLEFILFNDNYTSTAFDLDEIFLGSWVEEE